MGTKIQNVSASVAKILTISEKSVSCKSPTLWKCNTSLECPLNLAFQKRPVFISKPFPFSSLGAFDDIDSRSVVFFQEASLKDLQVSLVDKSPSSLHLQSSLSLV